MNNCPNCNKKLSKFKTGLIYRAGDKRFCSIKCKKEYKDKFVSSRSSFQDRLLKQKLLNDLKKKQVEIETEIKISGKKPSKEDKIRLQKINELESELKVSLWVKLTGGGIMGWIIGAFLMVIGALLSFTIIGAIIGIPLFIIGFIMLVGGVLVTLFGIGSGATSGIVKAIKKSKENKKN